MWIETIDGSIINTNALEKIEVKHQNGSTTSPETKVIRHEINTENMTPEEKEKLKKEFEMLLKHAAPSEGKKVDETEPTETDIDESFYEICAWKANGHSEPYILFSGKKEDCEIFFTDLKRRLGTHTTQ